MTDETTADPRGTIVVYDESIPVIDGWTGKPAGRIEGTRIVASALDLPPLEDKASELALLVHPSAEPELVQQLRDACVAGGFTLIVDDGPSRRVSALDMLGPSMRRLMPFSRLNEDQTVTLSSEPFVKPNAPWYNKHRKGRR
jgi:hypothetical protein